jgi:hypothetical protein
LHLGCPGDGAVGILDDIAGSAASSAWIIGFISVPVATEVRVNIAIKRLLLAGFENHSYVFGSE